MRQSAAGALLAWKQKQSVTDALLARKQDGVPRYCAAPRSDEAG